MFNKNNLKYVFIIAFGFFWCSSLYLTQEQYLAKYADVNFVNTVELLYGSLSMALGILVFGLLYKKNKNVKILYIIFMLLSIITMITFFATKKIYIMSICMCLNCFLGTAGFGAGYHFSLLACNIIKEYRGRVFAIGYGLGSIGTYLIVLLPESFYSSIMSLMIYIPALLLNLYLVTSKTNLIDIKDEKHTISYESYLFKLSIIILAMSLLSALSTDVIAIHTINISGGYGNTRLYYCMGLLVAGFIADKKTDLFEILTIVSFIVSLLVIVLLNENYSINLIAALSYFFVAFFVLFRTIVFVNLTDNKKDMVYASAFGLMFSRIMEGLLVIFEDRLLLHNTLLIIIISILLSVVIIIYFLIFFNSKNESLNDKIKQITIRYKLSVQEEKVLALLVEGKTNQEISERLFISVYTVKRHVANIYHKTEMKKKELIEKVYN